MIRIIVIYEYLYGKSNWFFDRVRYPVIVKEGEILMEMIKTWIRRTCMILMAGLICVSLLLPNFSADAAGTTGTVKFRVLNVRKEASTSSGIVCKLSQGSKVSVVSEKTGTDGLKWYNVSFSYNGSTYKGYVRADLLEVSNASSGSTQTPSSGSAAADADVLYVNCASIKVRESPSTSSAVVTGLLKDHAVDVRGTKTGTDGRQWIKVSFNKDGQRLHGYIRSDLLTVTRPAGAAAPSDNPVANNYTNTGSAPVEGDILQVNASAVRVRKQATESSDVVANLLQGDQVKLKSVKTGADGRQWSKVSFTINGTKYHGYIRSDLLTKTASSSSGSSSSGDDSDIRYITASGVRVRSSASTSSDVIANLLQGDQVSFRSVKTGDDGKEWTKVSFTIHETRYRGYVRSDYLSRTKPSDNSSQNATSGAVSSNTGTQPKSGTVRLAVINVRQSATTSSGIAAKIRQGTTVTILSETTGSDGRKWYNISCAHNGSTVKGYVRSDLLNL